MGQAKIIMYDDTSVRADTIEVRSILYENTNMLHELQFIIG